MRQCRLLGFCQILKKCPCCDHTAVIILDSQSLQSIYMKMFFQSAFAQSIIKVPVIQWENADPKTFFQIVSVNATHKKSVITDDLGRNKFVDLIQKFLWSVNFCQETVSCSNICNGTAKMIFHGYNRHQIVVFGFVQRCGIQCGSRSDHTYHFSFYQSFCFLRVFHLFADCNLMSIFDQSFYVCFCCMKRDATHRRSFFQPTVLACQCKLKFFRYKKSVIEKHLVKIAQSVEQYGIFVFFLSFTIFAHHRAHLFVAHKTPYLYGFTPPLS